MFELVKCPIERLDQRLTRNGWAGYDPYDLKRLPFFCKKQSLSFKVPPFLDKNGGTLLYPGKPGIIYLIDRHSAPPNGVFRYYPLMYCTVTFNLYPASKTVRQLGDKI